MKNKLHIKIQDGKSTNTYVLGEVLLLFAGLLMTVLSFYVAVDAVFGRKVDPQFLMMVCIDTAFLIVIFTYKNLRKIQVFGNFHIPSFATIGNCFLISIGIVLMWPFLDVLTFLKEVWNRDFQYSIVFREDHLGIRGAMRYEFFRTILIIPVLEEIFYRKIIFEKINAKYSLVIAMFLSSFLFSLGHLDLDFFFIPYFVGLVLSYSYYQTSNLFVPILIHVLINFSNEFVV